MYAEFTSVSDHICNRLFSTGEDNFGTKKIANFCKLFGKYQDAEGKFEQLEHHLCIQNTEYSGVPRSNCLLSFTWIRVTGLVYKVLEICLC